MGQRRSLERSNKIFFSEPDQLFTTTRSRWRRRPTEARFLADPDGKRRKQSDSKLDRFAASARLLQPAVEQHELAAEKGPRGSRQAGAVEPAADSAQQLRARARDGERVGPLRGVVGPSEEARRVSQPRKSIQRQSPNERYFLRAVKMQNIASC